MKKPIEPDFNVLGMDPGTKTTTIVLHPPRFVSLGYSDRMVYNFHHDKKGRALLVYVEGSGANLPAAEALLERTRNDRTIRGVTVTRPSKG